MPNNAHTKDTMQQNVTCNNEKENKEAVTQNHVTCTQEAGANRRIKRIRLQSESALCKHKNGDSVQHN